MAKNTTDCSNGSWKNYPLPSPLFVIPVHLLPSVGMKVRYDQDRADLRYIYRYR